MKYFFGLYFKYFISLKTLEMEGFAPLSPTATRLVATVF